MSIGLNAIAAAAATVLLAGSAGSASAQPEYGYGQLPPAPYQEAGGYGGGSSCGRGSFTLIGAHAGVTVLGVDLDAGARLGVPYDSGCSGGGYEAQQYQPRPQAPQQGPVGYGGPPPYGYPSQPYGYQGYAAPSYQQSGYGYAPMPEGPPPAYYGSPCGCEVPRGW